MHVSKQCAAEGCIHAKTCDDHLTYKMVDPDVERAYKMLAMHHSETLLHVQELEKQLRRQSIIDILKARLRYWTKE